MARSRSARGSSPGDRAEQRVDLGLGERLRDPLRHARRADLLARVVVERAPRPAQKRWNDRTATSARAIDASL